MSCRHSKRNMLETNLSIFSPKPTLLLDITGLYSPNQCSAKHCLDNSLKVLSSHVATPLSNHLPCTGAAQTTALLFRPRAAPSFYPLSRIKDIALWHLQPSPPEFRAGSWCSDARMSAQRERDPKGPMGYPLTGWVPQATPIFCNRLFL